MLAGISKNFANVAQQITGAGRTVFQKYQDNKDDVNSVAIFAVPTVAAWSCFSPWVAVPVTIGGAVSASMPYAEHNEYKYRPEIGRHFMNGVMVLGPSLVAIIYSSIIQSYVDPQQTPPSVKDTVNSVCWATNKKLPLKVDNKTYTVTIKEIENTSSVNMSNQTHAAKYEVTFPYNDFVTGKPVVEKEEFTTATRPGFWNPKTDTATVNNVPIRLQCN